MADDAGSPMARSLEDGGDGKKPVPPEFPSFALWPPSLRTREAVARRLAETLVSDSVISKRYGSIPADEADSAAQRIEQEGFSAASESKIGSENGSAATIEDGLEILHVYSREISRRMLHFAKSRPTLDVVSNPASAPEIVSGLASDPSSRPSTATTSDAAAES